jgi:hypothetical protein
MRMMISSCLANRQVGTASPMSISMMCLPEVCPDRLVGEDLSIPQCAEDAIVVLIRLWSGSCYVRFCCCNIFISGIDDTRHKEFGSLRVYYIYHFELVLLYS